MVSIIHPLNLLIRGLQAQLNTLASYIRLVPKNSWIWPQSHMGECLSLKNSRIAVLPTRSPPCIWSRHPWGTSWATIIVSGCTWILLSSYLCLLMFTSRLVRYHSPYRINISHTYEIERICYGRQGSQYIVNLVASV